MVSLVVTVLDSEAVRTEIVHEIGANFDQKLDIFVNKHVIYKKLPKFYVECGNQC